MLMPSLCSPRTHAFSLLELVSVLAILATLTAFSAWSLPGYLHTTKLHQATATLVQLSEMARQNAMTHNSPAALAIRTSGPNGRSDYRALSILSYDTAAETWKPLIEWTQLPEGVSVSAQPEESTFLQDAPEFSGNLLLSYQGVQVTPAELCVRIYTPTGQVVTDDPNTCLNLRVVSSTNPDTQFQVVAINPQNGRCLVQQTF